MLHLYLSRIASYFYYFVAYLNYIFISSHDNAFSQNMASVGHPVPIRDVWRAAESPQRLTILLNGKKSIERGTEFVTAARRFGFHLSEIIRRITRYRTPSPSRTPRQRCSLPNWHDTRPSNSSTRKRKVRLRTR